ncbi:hypothetical protein Csa_023830, partial [Cucumis sativus]
MQEYLIWLGLSSVLFLLVRASRSLTPKLSIKLEKICC